MKSRKKVWLAGLIFALTVSSLSAGTGADEVLAAKKMKLNSKKIIVQKRKKKKVSIKNAKKRKIKWKITKKSIASIKKKGKYAVWVTGKKKGKTTLTCKVKNGRKWKSFKCSVVVKNKKKVKEAPVVTQKSGNGSGAAAESSKPSAGTGGGSGLNVSDPTPTPGETTTSRNVSDADGPALKDLYADYFFMGGAINGNDRKTAAINHEGMAKVLKKHYNSTTLSNLMKPRYLLDEKECAKKGEISANATEVALNFDSCKDSLDFCKENGIQMRGHVLVWHNQTPEWFFKENYDAKKGYVSKTIMAKRMENYIKGVLEYCQKNYPGVVYCWDVVNESVDDGAGDSSVNWNCRTTFNGGDNFWYATMGTDYVEKAFEYARKYADPDVKLIYNDYNVFMPKKLESIYNLVKGLKEKNLIDGIGLQPTVGLYNPDELKGDSVDSFENCLKKYAELDVDIQITELSFKIDEKTGERNEKSLKRQADRYQEMFELLKKMDTAGGGPCNITSVTVFGICDDYPLYDDTVQCLYLWDKDCKAKEAFYRIREVGERK